MLSWVLVDQVNAGFAMHPYPKDISEIWWSRAVARTTPQEATGLYRKRFALDADTRIATGGSCFAQHIARYLRSNGYNVIDNEPAPFGLSDKAKLEFGYGIYSCRYGNIYHVRQLRQLLEEAIDGRPRDGIAWERKNRFYDALRPGVEPEGLDSANDVKLHRERHLKRVRAMFEKTNVFVFTMGLTEAWVDAQTGVVFPSFPGSYTQFDPDIHVFKNFRVSEIYDDFVAFRSLLKIINPSVKFIVTVSPVPLMATATQSHVLPATTYSKSALRAVASQLYDDFEDIDYFPSYEIISSPWSKGAFFAPDLRSVTDEGVATVMRAFFLEHRPTAQAEELPIASLEEVVCEEVLLEAFSR